jgi:sugar diacid utilization regulator
MNRIYFILPLALGVVFMLASLPAFAQDNSIQNTIDSLNLVIHKRPADPFPVYHKANLFLITGSKDEAFRFFKQVVLLFTQNPDSLYRNNAADSYYQMSLLTFTKNKKEAYNYALGALQIKPKEKLYRIQQARVLVEIPETKKDGINFYETLVKEYPTDTEVLLEYAAFLERESPERASAMYEKVLRNNPTDAKSLFALGNYEVNVGLKQTKPDAATKHYLKAEGYLAAALQQQPENDVYRKKLGDLYSTLAWYYKDQRNKEAAAKTKEYKQKLADLGLKN